MRGKRDLKVYRDESSYANPGNLSKSMAGYICYDTTTQSLCAVWVLGSYPARRSPCSSSSTAAIRGDGIVRTQHPQVRWPSINPKVGLSVVLKAS